MSIHSSLRGGDTLRGERSVLTRFERIQKLAKDGKLKTDEGSAWGLPKVRTKFKSLSTKKKKAEAVPGEGAPAAAPTPVEPAGKTPGGKAPAAGKAPAGKAPAGKGAGKK